MGNFLNTIYKSLFLAICIAIGSSISVYAQFGKTYSSQKKKYNIDYGTPIEYTIAGVDVVGAEFNDKNALISIAGFEIGQKIKIPGENISKAIKKLWRLGIVGDVQINITEIQGTDVYLQISLKERPKLSKYYFEGITKGQQTTLTDKINLNKGRIVTDAMIRTTSNIIKKHYAEKGFYHCDVKIVREDDAILANSVVLRIEVNKGSKIKINDIQLTGISEITEKKALKKLKKTKEARFGRIFTPSKFIVEKYEEDKDNLVGFYNENGYRNAEILRDTVYDFNEQRVNIELDLYEGQKFFYRNITWTGNYKYNDEQLAKVLSIKKGDTYNPTELQERLSFNPAGSDITGLYMDDGYLFFSIKPVEVLVEGDSIDIEMRIYEGEQAYINKIITNGNTKTNDHVVIREIRTLPGDKFSRSDLIRTQRELSTLGYFDPEQLNPVPKPNMSDGTVDVEYELVEKPSDQIELSGGWGGFYGFVGTVGLVFNNFSLKNTTDFSKWRPLPAGDGQRLQLRAQISGPQYQTYSFSFTEPWLGGRKPNSLTVSYNYSRQQFLSDATTVDSKMGIHSLSARFGKRMTWPDDWFTFSTSLSYMVYDLDNWTQFGFDEYPNGKSYSIPLNITFARNSVDQPTYPRRGSNFSFSATFTPPYSLFDGKDYSNDELTADEQYKWVEYHKYMIDNAWYASLVGNLVFSARAHFGFIAPYNKDKGLGPFERFFLGGDGMTQQFTMIGAETIGLRGYENGSIVPPDPDNPLNRDFSNSLGGVAYNKFVMELRYPATLNPAATIYGLVFAEAGNNFDSFENYNPFDLYKSAGAGIRVFMPAFGMLGLDWAYGFDEVPGAGPDASGSQIHFIIGQQIR